MKLITTIPEMQELSTNWRVVTGFVPTMGYLHAGHLSLVQRAVAENQNVVVSIFVNPSQFGPGEDYNNYPRDLEKDLELLKTCRVTHAFLPKDNDMYPEGYQTWVSVDGLSKILCGRSRPHHFRGVTTIVTKLLHIVKPQNIYLGEKDFQQLVILRKMVQDLNIPCRVVGCPIMREKDGLAMSSRNKYLSLAERQQALCLYNSLQLAQELYSSGVRNKQEVVAEMKELILKQKGDIDYIDVVDPENLSSLSELVRGSRILLAVRIGQTRLIDNLEIV
ncbi:MAG: pantoate--beta-alanine ligase [Candidatus Cloacimonetes bacterium]|nr:pantoate--beta-alanine ligase [Candidatus Cloacimonadota bacterium]